jgi:hypothetical protein
MAETLPTKMTGGAINNIVPAGSGGMFLSIWDTSDPDIADVGLVASRYVRV